VTGGAGIHQPPTWMMWNHIRTLGTAGGTVSLLLALRSG
jgi:uncharacterized membrane protein